MGLPFRLWFLGYADDGCEWAFSYVLIHFSGFGQLLAVEVRGFLLGIEPCVFTAIFLLARCGLINGGRYRGRLYSFGQVGRMRFCRRLVALLGCVV